MLNGGRCIRAMDNIKKVYDEIIEESKKKKSFGGIDFKAFKEFEMSKISRLVERIYECMNAEVEVGSDSIVQDIINEPWEQPECPKRISREEQYIINAKKLKDIDIEEGIIIPCELSSYNTSYAYHKLTFEEFCSYLYWRTQVRNKIDCVTPIPFLWLYLAELCNFVEFETVEETYDMLQYLLSTQKKLYAKTIIREAMSDFFVYYGTMEQVQKHRERICYFKSVKDSLSFLNGTYSNSFDFIASKISYVIKGSAVYQECPETVKKYFLLFFSNMIRLLKDKKVDIVSLYLGKYEFRKSHEFMIKTVRQDLVIEKVFREDDILLMEVTKDGVYEARMECLGQDVDPGECIFHRGYVFAYPFKSFDNKLREFLGLQPVEASTKDIHKMLDQDRKYPNLQKIVDFYESEEFIECLEKSLSGCEIELEQEREANRLVPKETVEYIYCGVEFEDKKRVYSYITDDDSISIGDTVVVPTGQYNYEDIATVCSVDRYTELNAPFPPQKTKRIIRKYKSK